MPRSTLRGGQVLPNAALTPPGRGSSTARRAAQLYSFAQKPVKNSAEAKPGGAGNFPLPSAVSTQAEGAAPGTARRSSHVDHHRSNDRMATAVSRVWVR